ncbi:MAG: XdhC family protein [Planctomycetes bacterium]|nr:XdhC family protein [Planctomycetota bacterium]
MAVSRQVMHKAVELLDAGVPFALCTVIRAVGSVPARDGTKMIVLADGTIFGTVGGAGVEEKAKNVARTCLSEGKGGLFKFDLAYYKEGGLDSLCGGTVEIAVEIMAARPHVLICGGGHVGLEVAKLCDQLEYAYSVLDDRPAYCSRERFPNAQELCISPPDQFFSSRQDLSAFTHMILLGYSHRVDTEILYHCLKRFKGWIGVIASKLKRRELLIRLKARGVTEEEFARVEAPVGIPIGSESPAECAVSILGSIIRSYKLGLRPSRTQRVREDPEEGSTPEDAEDPEKALRREEGEAAEQGNG